MIYCYNNCLNIFGTRHIWLRHCTKSWKVAGSIPDYVTTRIFSDNPSGCIKAQEYFLGGKGSQCIGLTTLPPSCADCLEICGLQPLTLWTWRGLNKVWFIFAFTFFFSGERWKSRRPEQSHMHYFWSFTLGKEGYYWIQHAIKYNVMPVLNRDKEM
jgi:hypothetical protein